MYYCKCSTGHFRFMNICTKSYRHSSVHSAVYRSNESKFMCIKMNSNNKESSLLTRRMIVVVAIYSSMSRREFQVISFMIWKSCIFRDSKKRKTNATFISYTHHTKTIAKHVRYICRFLLGTCISGCVNLLVLLLILSNGLNIRRRLRMGIR